MPPGFTAPAKFTCVFEPTPRCGELTPPALPETEGSPPAALPARAGALPANRAGGGGGDGSDASIIPFSAMTTRLALIRSTATKRSGGGGGGGAGAIPAVVGAHATCERDAVTWAVLLRVGDGAKASVMHEARQLLSACAAHGWVYAMGGFDGRKTCGDVFAYDVRIDKWMPHQPMTTVRLGLGAVAAQ